MKEQCADTIVLVKPVAFGLNPDAADNAFIQFDSSISNPQEKALREFESLRTALEENGVHVIVFEDTQEVRTPDSIFPNNVMSTDENGTVIFYSMKPENRSLEVVKHRQWVRQLQEKFEIHEIVDYSPERQKNLYLEGTGSMVLDRKNKIVYACRSERTNPVLLQKWAAQQHYEICQFDAFQTSSSGDIVSVYHTNILMCVGTNFVSIYLDAIPGEAEREKLLQYFSKTNKEVIPLTKQQFLLCAGNMLEVKNTEGKNLVVMSQRAFESLGSHQRKTLERLSGKIVTADISTIEEIGGGSARCMMLEVFLPRKNGNH